MSEHIYSSPVSQLTSSTFAVSFWHSVVVVSICNTELRESYLRLNSVTEVKDWFEAMLMKYCK